MPETRESKQQEDYLHECWQFLNLPEPMWEGMRLYLLHGVMPGSFMCSVLKNDLRGACDYGDDTNKPLLHVYVRFLYNYAPAGSWGSEERFTAWLKNGGILAGGGSG